MSALRAAAMALIVAGVLALAYGGFSYTRQTHEAQVGPVGLSISERQTVSVPMWAGVGAIAGGLLLLVLSSRRS